MSFPFRQPVNQEDSPDESSNCEPPSYAKPASSDDKWSPPDYAKPAKTEETKKHSILIFN